MKNTRLLTILTLLLFAVLLVGCSTGPGNTVQKFFQAVDKGQIEEAMGYLSSSTLQTLGTDKWRAALVEASSQMAAEGGLRSVKIVEENVNGEIAQVTVSITVGDGTEETESIDLIMEDGDWKIHIDLWSK